MCAAPSRTEQVTSKELAAAEAVLAEAEELLATLIVDLPDSADVRGAG